MARLPAACLPLRWYVHTVISCLFVQASKEGSFTLWSNRRVVSQFSPRPTHYDPVRVASLHSYSFASSSNDCALNSSSPKHSSNERPLQGRSGPALSAAWLIFFVQCSCLAEDAPPSLSLSPCSRSQAEGHLERRWSCYCSCQCY